MPYPSLLDRLSKVAIDDGMLRRIAITTRCGDCGDIPKQPGAGSIREVDPWPVQVMHNGVLVARDCYFGPWMTRIIEQLEGHHEPQEERVFHEILASLPDAKTMFELGAFWSYYSLWFLDRFPHGRTILVEPDPNFLAIGQYNYALNGREGHFIQASVAAQPGEAIGFRCESDGAVRQVPLVSVDSLVDRLNVDRIDVLLADIQGAEVAMLEGMEETLRRQRLSTLVVSTHDQSISGDFRTHEKCLDWIKDHGGRIIAEHSVEESFSGDGMIAASFDARCRITVDVSRNRAVDSLFGSPTARLAEMEKRLSQISDTQRVAAQVAVAAASNERRLRLEAAPPRTAMYNVARPRKWWRQLPEVLAQAKARRRIAALRRAGRTQVIIGQYAQFEVLADEQMITPSLMRDLHWEYPALEQAVRIVASETGSPLTSTTLVDIGANIGLIGLQAVSSGLVERCIAFEPDPVNYALLVANVQLNGLDDRFELHAVALGDRRGSCRFELSGSNCGDHRVRCERPATTENRFDESSREVIKVPMRTLDEMMSRSQTLFRDHIGLCWMDVQGFEATILRGGRRTLSVRAWPSVLEFWPYGMLRAGVTGAEITELLGSIWGRFTLLCEGQPPAWQPVSQTRDLWQSLGETGNFTNILLA